MNRHAFFVSYIFVSALILDLHVASVIHTSSFLQLVIKAFTFIYSFKWLLVVIH